MNSITCRAAILAVSLCNWFPVKAMAAEQMIGVAIGADEIAFQLIQPRADGIDYPQFYIQETEVTNQQYQQYLLDSERTKDDTDVFEILEKRKAEVAALSTQHRRAVVWQPLWESYSIDDPASNWRKGQFPQGQESFPVALVTLSDAEDFCRWLTQKHPDRGLFRLPTWNEWMIAAYGKTRNYPWGNDWQTSHVHTSYGYTWSMSDDRRPKRTEPVKSRPQGKTPQGVYGMLGNVAEYLCVGDSTSEEYLNLGARWMGGGFKDGPTLLDERADRIQSRADYWGYSHWGAPRKCDLGFRVILDPDKNLELVKRPRIFAPRNEAWMVTPNAKTPANDNARKAEKDNE
jgi:formylglycine-generating enzyme required for sulfatase activity